MNTSPHPDRPILIVEDSPEDLYTLQRLLRASGLARPILHCEDGDSALNLLFRRGEHGRAPRPAVILLDLNLPGTDGREVLMTLKQHPHLKQIPIIVLSTSSARQDVERSYRMGANSYITKSVNYDGFAHAIQVLVDYWFEVSLLPDLRIIHEQE